MARKFSNALRIALGGVAGGLEGYGEKQEREAKASLLKQQQERQERQDAINLAKSLVSDFNFRPDFGEEDAIASPMLTSRQPTRLDTTLPTFGAGLAPAMERTRRESFGITPETPVAQPKPLVSALTQAEQMQPPRPRTDGLTIDVPGFGSMRMRRPETPEEKANRALQAYRAERVVDAEIEAEKNLAKATAMTKSVNETARLIQKTFRLSDGKPLSNEASLYAAQSGETPIELGLVEKPMTEAERKRLGLDWARLNLDRKKANQEQIGAGGKPKADPMQMRLRGGMNEMLIANRAMEEFERKFNNGEAKITVGQRVLQKLATDFSNEKTTIDKIMTSSAYKILAEANPELAEYMRNVDAFAEGETMVAARPSNFRTKMAQFLSGIAAGSPPQVVTRVMQRRRGLLQPMVDAYYQGDWQNAESSAIQEVGGREQSTESSLGSSTTLPNDPIARGMFLNAWKQANPKGDTETPAAYAQRMQNALTAAMRGQ